MSDEPTGAGDDLVTCEITGRMLPESETVVFRGRRVSAEGKAVMLERLAAGEVMPGELERPSAFLRFACMFVDGLIFGVVFLIIGFLLLGTVVFGGFGGASPAAVGLGNVVFQLVVTVIRIGYYTWMHGTYGQTLGKMVGKTRVVRLDGSPIGMNLAFARALYLEGPGIVSQVVVSAGMLASVNAVVVVGGILSLISGIYIIASIIVAIVDRDKQRAIHDHLAGTRVIKVG